MKKHKQMNVQEAIDLLKSGGTIEEVIISDLATSKVNAMDALLLAKNGCVVPDGNIVYDDDQIQFDPDFDEVTWSKPVPFRQIKELLTAEIAERTSEFTEVVVQLKIQSPDMKNWLIRNKAQLDLVISGLIENMYKAEQFTKQ